MSISMFDILGPITVGPSSSHTAGAVRIGLAARTILGEEVKTAKITFYGSFADTYRGHGTDKAVVGGLLGFNTENVKIRESLQLAQFRGMKYEFFTAEEARYHPNTLKIEASGKTKSITLRGASIGGGQIRIQELNGFPMEASCLMDTLLVVHKDSPGVLANIAMTLNQAGYNIGNLRLNRTKREGDVITVIENDTKVDEKTMEAMRKIQDVLRVISMPKF
ncbi:L-serine ammonia-lyase, iron-sulfur-dependent subunit beta [Acidaminobacterium chupaoyuni]